jgi:hypothetical protein
MSSMGRVQPTNPLNSLPEAYRSSWAITQLTFVKNGSRPNAVFSVGVMGVSNGRESGRSPPGRFGAPEPQRSGAGQRSFVSAGNRPKSDTGRPELLAAKRPFALVAHDHDDQRC